ncbi:vomeronasal type-2 receptor 26-like [Rana temporaria]|uniref:vomeronasal type-2 receptor 26-like n=1 Tax=Rana temporaria TaxID=8407 RepID=UPI001AADAD22|nr:vomeronasal type-2 receptor 26-like [Rana temporaria]
MFEYEYYQEGDVIVGGFISAHSRAELYDDSSVSYFCHDPDIGEYKSILAMIFAVDEINKDPDLLPNVTLGYHIFDTCGYPERTLGSVLQILSGEKMEAPNYSCRRDGEVAGFIGDSGLHTSQAMAQLLSLYRYTQINYQVTDPLLSDRKLYPTLYRMTSNNLDFYAAIIKSLQHFGWNWVGLVAPGDGSGDKEIEELSKMMSRHGICIEYTIKFTDYQGGRTKKMEMIEKSTAKLHHFVRNIHYTDPTGEEIFFNNDGEIQSRLILANWILHKNGEGYESAFQPLASFDGGKAIDGIFNINPEDVAWKGGTMPMSRCNDRCPPGYRKAHKGSVHVCCYDCVPCSEGAVSNVTDSDGCFQCPDEEWPDDKKIKCISKTYEFLSYENDVMALIFSLISLTFSAMTLFVFGNFIYHRDTPVVKANNRTVSFILLTAILLSFLCVFFFLGRPVDITCMLRQVSFGIVFSIAVSCVLAKTTIVCIAFKATKPGSSWKKWVTVKASNSLVLICSSVQVVICVVWLSVSPPYQEYDMDSYPGKILIQCNEGSVIGFYSMLGYMGFLAAVSFLLAFMVRTLPDSFNEAKYITFSMLVFCSVWIAMIPAYLSTRGKYMVAVEIFAILTSSAGILGCIFFPKCYIIILNPGLNNRRKNTLQKINLRT